MRELNRLGRRVEGAPLFGGGDRIRPRRQFGEFIEAKRRVGGHPLLTVLRAAQRKVDAWNPLRCVRSLLHASTQVERQPLDGVLRAMAGEMDHGHPVRTGSIRPTRGQEHEQGQQAHRAQSPTLIKLHRCHIHHRFGFFGETEK